LVSSASHYRNTVEETFMASASVCHRTWVAEVVSNALGHDHNWDESSVGRYWRRCRSCQDRIVTWKVTLVMAWCFGRNPRGWIRHDAVTGIAILVGIPNC
jgi:hypothetical protein